MPTETPESRSLFKWETMKEMGSHELNYRQPIPGKAFEVELTSGQKVTVWKADNGQEYFCHGLTFGGKEAPGGPVSPYSGQTVQTIFQYHYDLVPVEIQATIGDIIVWIAAENTPHSAILETLVVDPSKNYLDYSTVLRTKNGIQPETSMTLEHLITDYYGESYNVYRRR